VEDRISDGRREDDEVQAFREQFGGDHFPRQRRVPMNEEDLEYALVEVEYPQDEEEGMGIGRGEVHGQGGALLDGEVSNFFVGARQGFPEVGGVLGLLFQQGRRQDIHLGGQEQPGEDDDGDRVDDDLEEGSETSH